MPFYLLALLLAVSLSAAAFWVFSKDDPNAKTAASRMEVETSDVPAELEKAESPISLAEEPKRRTEEQLTESKTLPHIGTRRYSDGDIQVLRDGPIRVEQIAENCGMTETGWTCDWRLEVYNPYEALGESELRGLADFDPYAALMLAEALRKREATESEVFDALARAVALFPNEDKGRAWMHMMGTLGKAYSRWPDRSDAELVEGYAWLLAGRELGILSMEATMSIEQELQRRELSTEIGKRQATRIAEQVRATFLSTGNNQ